MPGQLRWKPITAQAKENLFYRVYILLSEHERRLEEFEKIMQTRHTVEGSHNFQEISQPSECLIYLRFPYTLCLLPNFRYLFFH